MTHPTNFMLELGNVCNLHCRMCPREYEYVQSMKKGCMPFEKEYKIIDEIYPYLDSICLTGLGETLMSPHLLEVAQYIKSKKKSIIITISTNANQTDYRLKIVPLLPYIDNIQFSVDGIGSIYETIRPNTDFDEVSDNISYTVEANKHATYMINFVVMPENLKDMPNVIEYAHQQHIDYLTSTVSAFRHAPTSIAVSINSSDPTNMSM